MAKKKKEKIYKYFGIELTFADDTPVTPDMWENESSQAAMDRAEAIDEDELDEEIRILDELREHPERAEELSHKGGISYKVKDD